MSVRSGQWCRKRTWEDVLRCRWNEGVASTGGIVKDEMSGNQPDQHEGEQRELHLGLDEHVSTIEVEGED
jgi:hypothetical protein